MKLIKTFFIGFATSLMASACMNIYYFYFRSRINSGAASLITCAIIGFIVGAILSLLLNRNRLADKSLRNGMLMRALLTGIIITGISTTVWYYYNVEYFRLKDDGPLALTVALILLAWELLNSTARHIDKRA
jgi:hypothetical protein